jgi:dihydroorotate dehydrogenase electron transfer subunit
LAEIVVRVFVHTLKRFDKTCRIISNKEICAGYFELKVKIGSISEHCSPGQFFMIGIPGVFLRRPLSIHDFKNGVLSFLYKIVGKGTAILSKMQSGELQFLGPLGDGYNLETYKDLNHVIVVGGTGIASMYFLVTKLKKKGILYYGARSKKDLLCIDKFKNKGWEVIVATEDGTKGYKGYITDILETKIKNNDVLFACGPMLMLKKVSHIIKEKGVKGFVSLEEKMACGVGNCQGCAVKIDGQIKMVCKDGPVFKMGTIDFQ